MSNTGNPSVFFPPCPRISQTAYAQAITPSTPGTATGLAHPCDSTVNQIARVGVKLESGGITQAIQDKKESL